MISRAIDQTLFSSYSEDIPVFLKKIYAARGLAESQLSLTLSDLLRPDFSELDENKV